MARTEPASSNYVLVYLKSGPKSGTGSKEDRAKMFAGHMANLHRLADEGKLLIAGPFDSPADKSWRGLMLLDVATVDEAQKLAATDPGVQAGEFVAECHRVQGPDKLRGTGANEKKMLAEQKNALTPAPAADPSKPPPNIRPYVMVTTHTAADPHAAIKPELCKPVWQVSFVDTKGGVLVIDANKAADAVVSQVPAGITVDGWWSTASLTMLNTP